MSLNNLIYKVKKIVSPYKMAIITVVISVLATAVVSGVSAMGKVAINKEMSGIGLNGLSIMIYGENAENFTDIKLYNDLLTIGGIDKITPVLYEQATLQFKNNMLFSTMAWGVSSQAEEIVSLTITNGRMLNDEDIKKNAKVCLVDEEIAMKAYKRSNIVGKKIYINIYGNQYIFEVIGTIKKGSSILNNMAGDIIPNFIYIPYTTMKNISTKSNFDQIIFQPNNSDMSAVEIKEKLVNLSTEYNSRSVKLNNLTQQREQIMNIANTAFAALFLVSCVAVLVCSISVGASVNTAVSIKQKDIGIKTSLGASKLSITIEFLLSAILSCILGVVVALIIAITLFGIAANIFNIAFVFDYPLIILSVFATILLTTFFSLFPSYRAATLEPIKALNRE